MNAETQSFLNGHTDTLVDDVDGHIIQIHAEETVTCYCEWGGWHWEAEDTTRDGALRRLGTRLNLKDPFFGADTDHGDPGYQTGELSDQIPIAMRAQMRALSDERGENHPDDHEARARDEAAS